MLPVSLQIYTFNNFIIFTTLNPLMLWLSSCFVSHIKPRVIQNIYDIAIFVKWHQIMMKWNRNVTEKTIFRNIYNIYL